MTGQRPDEHLDSATIQIRRLAEGHAEAQAWLIDRFTPPLYVAARRRIERHLKGLYDPEDLVQDVWAVALPRLRDLRPRGGHLTPVILRFLSSTLMHRYGNLLQKHLRERPLGAEAQPGPSGDGVKDLPDDTTTIVSGAIRREACDTFRETLEQLSPDDQRIVVLRGIEQVSNRDAAMLLGLPQATVSSRYRRALQRLKRLLPDTIFEDLPDPG